MNRSDSYADAVTHHGEQAGTLNIGHADLVVNDFRSNNLDYFRGDGAGGFAEAVDAGAPVNAFDIKDVNGDGFPDIVTANNDHTLSVLINRGTCRPARRRAARH